MLDLEDTGGLSSSALQTWVKAFLQRIYDRTGVRAVIYVSPAFWSSKMGNSNWFAKNGYDVLWIAHWTTAKLPERSRRELGWQELDLLAVHVGRFGAGDQRTGRPRSLQRHRPFEGAHPVGAPFHRATGAGCHERLPAPSSARRRMMDALPTSDDCRDRT